MAKPDWGELQQRFLAEHAHSGVSPKEWCEAQGLNYATAKRYIKIANSQKKSANQTANSQSKPVGSKGSAGADKSKAKSNSERDIGNDAAGPCAPEDCSPSETKPIRGSRTAPPANPFQPGNSRALKHGGYSRRRLLPDDIIEDAEALTLEDELIRIKAASLTAEANAGRWEEELRNTHDPEQQGKLEAKIRAADKALDRNAARIESIYRTLDQMTLTRAMLPKIAAETDYRIVVTEKTVAETERIKTGGGSTTTVIHNALPLPGR
ncbi:hypothetical protein [Serratia quinivorans]|uniref:hypothetical protein n=1 Tax=Serratia quinivorans TaxID=137545 RepID=UPI002179FFEA|nr:hypothetical protein [Serratia quinivorans]CAI1106914.1 Uncharacterised protein [Serratia quinivorans]HEJ7884108.1 hypothetical protein [Serratia liquefaciens]